MRKSTLEQVTPEDMLKMLDIQAPDWAVRLADQQDFKDALRLSPTRAKELLRRRSTEKVWMVARAFAAVLLDKELGEERKGG